jgi:DMATS type aromatic prenyltransferase
VTSAHKIGDGDTVSLGAFGESRLGALCQALGLSGQQANEARALFRLISSSWANYPVGSRPPFRNDITDDGTPFEFSVGFETEKPELRLLFESQLTNGKLSPRSSWEAGINLQRQLQQQGLINTDRFDRIAPLFAPGSSPALPRFSLWHAAVLRCGAPSLYKAYVNPEILGAEHAAARLSEALAELGMAAPWRFIQERLPSDTRIPYLSVDLDAAPHARVKVYLTATHADAVDTLLAGCGNSRPGQAREWLRALTGFDGEYRERPILICYAFAGAAAHTPNATVHVPIRSYVSNDEEALKRAVPLLAKASARQLTAAMSGLARGPLAETRGILSYVSLRAGAECVRVTAYLAPGAYGVSAPGSATISAG